MPAAALALTALACLAALGALVAAMLTGRAVRAAATRPPEIPPELFNRLAFIDRSVEGVAGAMREEVRALREELRGQLSGLHGGLDSRLATAGAAQDTAFATLRREIGEGQTRVGETLKGATDSFGHTQTTRLAETNAAMKELSARLETQQQAARAAQKEALDALGLRLQALLDANDKRQAEMRTALDANMDKLRAENAEKLEQMRQTVDEKLQGTLEQRLGESFKLVSERLDTVHKGMGEMQAMAAEVGGLKRVMSNVKARGTWGEVQLGALLEDILTADQYERQVVVQAGSREAVDYAIILPGQDVEGRLLLPIDCKYPHEDYERLLAAHDAGDAALADEAGRALERAIRIQAKSISDKYIHPPATTNFALMYLPTEGLYAEVVRRPGLMADLQATCDVTVAGPTTLQAILSSFRMGFRTLAIAKRSSDVWRVLGEAKAEFTKYGQVWDKLGKQLGAAQNTVAEAGKRTRAVERKLRDVETVQVEGAAPELLAPDLLTMASPDDDDEAEAA